MKNKYVTFRLCLLSNKLLPNTLQRVKEILINYDENNIYHFEKGYENKFGVDAKCRIFRSVIEDCIKGNLEYNLFSVYCAIASKIPKNLKYAPIKRDELILRSAGIKSKSVKDSLPVQLEYLKDNWKLSIDDFKMLTENQIRYSIKQLKERKLIRYFEHKRRNYFTIELSEKELKERVQNDKK